MYQCISLGSKPLITYSTFKVLDSCMHAHMRGENIVKHERFATEFTTMSSLPCMAYFVLPQHRMIFERASANVTDMASLVGVDIDAMLSQTAFPRKSFVTLVAVVFKLRRMYG